ncbi:uncharacterized protein LOC129805601 isoform X2 [Phlebotomus papatasi]|uniref:uncharacterized protein LOC129805601 isoform X2 n=1 Tax=Phlebotomus papatasi TaxID=29031 RepID=UPI0024835ACC|nr:uncharacterized protein LOC129805601 isoform X2 [Phlebotomus papatasi]
MWTKSFNIEVIVICFLSLIPWPGPSVFKIQCSRESARVVRKIVQSKWLPILDKYQVILPLECPFHPMRDIFGPQNSAKKQNRPSQWTCGFCGKSFYEEKFLDLHFDNRHKNNINMAEDAVCLADYCDIMRCEVLLSHDSTLSFGDAAIISTDIEVWNEATAYRTAMTPSGPRDLARVPLRTNFFPPLSVFVPGTREASGSDAGHKSRKKQCKSQTEDANEGGGEQSSDNLNAADEDEESDDGNNTSACDKNLVDSALPAIDKKQQKLSELQRLKANCKTEDLDLLKKKCEVLIRDCIEGLLVNLSHQDFKEMEDELNRAVCWYLTCERYWEDSPSEPKPFPWGLVFVLVMVLSLGVCFCYYIIWVLFDSSDDMTISSSTQATARSSPLHARHHLAQPSQQTLYSHGPGAPGTVAETSSTAAGNSGFSEEFYSAATEMGDMGQNEHYIYVTYPPELKRRLLESCYNRTTRL